MDFEKFLRTALGAVAVSALIVDGGRAKLRAAAAKKPNILVIMGDNVGWFNIGAYHQGVMSGKTPNLDKLASEGMRFTDYYAEASCCTAGRADFITGELPIRTGLTTVGQAGADVGLPDQAVTLATALQAEGYETAQFGKNHLGDLNKYLPCVPSEPPRAPSSKAASASLPSSAGRGIFPPATLTNGIFSGLDWFLPHSHAPRPAIPTLNCSKA